MRSRLALLVVVPLMLAGCSSTSDGTGPGLDGDPFADQGGEAKTQDNGTNVPDAAVDCASITQPSLLAFGYGVQTLSTLGSQSAVDAVSSGSTTFDPEAFDLALTELGTLAGHGVDPYGDPAEALAYYADVNEAAMDLLAYSTPIPDGEFSAYDKVSGGSSNVIAQQASINASFNTYCAN